MNAGVPPELESVPEAGANSTDMTVLWHSAFGEILIEVKEGEVFVNGEKVQPAGSASSPDSERTT